MVDISTTTRVACTTLTAAKTTATARNAESWNDGPALDRRSAKFTEENDHEGETWVFWLQLDGNLEALRELELLLDHGAGEPLEVEDFELELDVELSEHDVDVLVERGGRGYLNNHNKVTGTFTCPTYDFESEDEYGEDFRNLFYKGRIVNYFTN